MSDRDWEHGSWTFDEVCGVAMISAGFGAIVGVAICLLAFVVIT